MKTLTKVIIGTAILAGSTTLHAGNILTNSAHADFHIRYADSMPEGLMELLESDYITEEESEALQFLYAYMPLSDILDYSPQFFLENIRASLSARKEFHWGKDVPDREFRHFVLPVRTNNENLDMSRPIFYGELYERVKNLSMQDAILEVNHWCHEKVTYQPSDARTNSPLATVCSALGRCGEESTFTVAALRAVGIPARQVYTPRWAHTDDNHAWVEAWADGKWWFLGACEPEPVLDLGWFNAPASRGMMMHTNVFGNYDGPEEQIDRTATTTNINVTSNYAPISYIDVTVCDKNGKPVENATVNFSLYNYAEFYPVAVKKTDIAGKAQLLAGLGDMVAWASDGKNFGIAKVNSQQPNKVVLNYDGNFTGTIDFDIVPPVSSPRMPRVTGEMADENDRRKAAEDQMRNAYTSTFYNEARSAALAERLGLDKERLTVDMVESRGNWPVIESFLVGLPADKRERGLDLLGSLSIKDMNDVTPDVLIDNLNTANPLNVADSIFKFNVLSPRVYNERLTPYKQFLTKAIGESNLAAYRENPAKWIEWVAENIVLDTVWNPSRYAVSPASVWKYRRADSRSRGIFTVAGLRTAGVPARIDAVTGKTQYYADDKWVDVNFDEDNMTSTAPTGQLRVVSAQQFNREPRYYYQFAITKVENGLPVLQEYPDDITLSELFAQPQDVDEGQYMLLSGQRMADGRVLARANFYRVEEGKLSTPELTILHDDTAPQVIGNFDAELKYRPQGSDDLCSILSTTGRGYYVLALIAPSHEPTSHALNDISAFKNDFENWGKKIMVMLPDGASDRFDATRFPNLPSTVVMGEDPNGSLYNALVEGLELKSTEMPIVVIADTFNRVVYAQQGYTIGLGEKLLNVISQLSE